MGFSHLSSPDDSLHADIETLIAVDDVLINTSSENCSFLRHVGNEPLDPTLGLRAEWFTVNKYLTFTW